MDRSKQIKHNTKDTYKKILKGSLQIQNVIQKKEHTTTELMQQNRFIAFPLYVLASKVIIQYTLQNNRKAVVRWQEKNVGCLRGGSKFGNVKVLEKDEKEEEGTVLPIK